MVAFTTEFNPNPHALPVSTQEDDFSGEPSIYSMSRRKALTEGLLIGCSKDTLGRVAREQFPCFHTAISAEVWCAIQRAAYNSRNDGVTLPDHFNGLLITLLKTIESKTQKGSNIYFCAHLGAEEYFLRADITNDPDYGRCLTILCANE